jgi:segregation and condensation protein A
MDETLDPGQDGRPNQENPMEGQAKIDVLIETPELTWRDILYEVIKGMDPWDINISELASRYAGKVEEMQEMNFRIPANVVLVSSVLLRMKSDILRPTETDPFLENKDAFSFLFNQDLSALAARDKTPAEYAIEAIAKPNRLMTRRVTAEELISAIQKALEERSQRKFRLESEGGRRVLVVATDWDITQIIDEVYGRIMEVLKERDCALFSELAASREDRIRVFTSILHLSNRQKLCLRQERIFEEIYIHPPGFVL